MGIEDEFEKILDIKATQYVPKPDPKSYDIMLKVLVFFKSNKNSIFIEDTAKNLKPAKLLGMKTVWMENERNLGDYKDNAEYVDYKYSDLKSFLNDTLKAIEWLKKNTVFKLNQIVQKHDYKKVLDLKERRFYIRLIVNLILYMVGTLFYKSISPFHNCIRDGKANVIECPAQYLVT